MYIYIFQDHQLTDTETGKNGKEILIDDVKSTDLINEHVGQHIENNEVKHQLKVPKTLSSEYMLNKKMIELMERNVKYVIL